MVENKDSFLDGDDDRRLAPDVETVTTPLLSAVAVPADDDGTRQREPASQSFLQAPPVFPSESIATPAGEPVAADDDSAWPPTADPQHQQHQQQRQYGAGIASGVLGLLVGGPFLAVILGFGAAYAAEQEGAAGDAARAVGDLALQARVKAREIDQKHHVVERSRETAERAWNRAQELDRQHRLLDRTKAFVAVSFAQISDYVRRHRVLERGIDAVGRAAYWVAEQVACKMASAASQSQSQTPTSGRSGAPSSSQPLSK